MTRHFQTWELVAAAISFIVVTIEWSDPLAGKFLAIPALMLMVICFVLQKDLEELDQRDTTTVASEHETTKDVEETLL